MQLFPRQVSSSSLKLKDISRAGSVRRSAVAMVCAAVLVSAGLAAGLAGPQDGVANLGLGLPEGAPSPAVKVVGSPAGIKAQMMVDDPRMVMNPEAFNMLRERKISNDSQKLLKLAIALKAEIDGSPGDESSPDAIAKAKEIEKLARDVKSRMSINPVLSNP